MTDGRPTPKSKGGGLLSGVSRLVRFRSDGWAMVPGTRQAFLNSLPPLLAFPLLSGLGLIFGGGGLVAGLVDLLSTLVALLAPAVLSELLARRWAREAEWLRYAVAFNWCQFAVAAAGAVAVFAVAGLMATGAARETTAGLALIATASYALVLQWFLARTGLRLSGLRAAAFTLFVNGGTGILALGPTLIAQGSH